MKVTNFVTKFKVVCEKRPLLVIKRMGAVAFSIFTGLFMLGLGLPSAMTALLLVIFLLFGGASLADLFDKVARVKITYTKKKLTSASQQPAAH